MFHFLYHFLYHHFHIFYHLYLLVIIVALCFAYKWHKGVSPVAVVTNLITTVKGWFNK
jgi:uncharacterized membrane protein YgaE (UPF0421/DUF939 family)